MGVDFSQNVHMYPRAMQMHTGPQIMHSGHVTEMHGTPRPAHLARTLMMVALLPRGAGDFLAAWGEDPDAVSYPESTHTSASVIQTACAQGAAVQTGE